MPEPFYSSVCHARHLRLPNLNDLRGTKQPEQVGMAAQRNKRRHLMNAHRSLNVSLIVLSALMFCIVNSVQAASIEEEANLLGPESGFQLCDGPVVGKTSVQTKSLSLAEKIVGKVFNKDKSSEDLTVSVRFRNGTPETEFNVFWFGLATPLDCGSTTSNSTIIGQITTDTRGRARERFRIIGGNPFPGEGVLLAVCFVGDPPGEVCVNPVFTSLLPGIFPPAP